jgi:hypothetical protein
VPKLRRKREGGYYYITFVHAAGGFSTRQVSEDGAALLRSEGISVGDDIPRWLLEELTARKLAYTGGTGLQIGLDPADLEVEQSPPWRELLRFITNEETGRWEIALAFPEIPVPLIAAIGSDTSVVTLAQCGLSINRGTPVPATLLWPGKGGATVPVAPSEFSIAVELTGDWPTSWREWALSECAGELEGLLPTGVLFRGREFGAVRLRDGVPIVPGQSYYLLLHADFARAPRGTLPPPHAIQRRRLGQRGGWEAWEIQLPDSIDDEIRVWCARLGHPLKPLPWRLVLASPPPQRYLADGMLVVGAGQEIIVAALPPSAHRTEMPPRLLVERDGSDVVVLSTGHTADRSTATAGQPSQRHFALPIDKNGKYQIWVAASRAGALAFVAESITPPPELTHLGSLPSPLEISVNGGSTHAFLHAFIDASGPHELILPRLVCDEVPSIEVWCPAPVSVRWGCGYLRRHYRQVPPTDVAALVASDLKAGLGAGQPFLLELDAGTFGSFALHLLPARPATPASRTIDAGMVLPDDMLQHARWLIDVLAIACRRRGSPMVPLTNDLRAMLAPLATSPDLAPLAQLVRVPATIIPHLRYVARALASSAGSNAGWVATGPLGPGLDRLDEERREGTGR